jgi:O-antigen/teichoic acid export membrane protein
MSNSRTEALSRPRHMPGIGRRLLQLIRNVLGLDRAIAWTVGGRLWSMSAGIATVLLIAHFLSPAQQGYYYTFSSLVALQVFFELGFAFVVLQMASHERATLTISEDGLVVGDSVSQARLASILQTSLRWYSAMALIMACTLLPAGLYFFQHADRVSAVEGWKVPWSIMALAASFNLLVDPVFSFLEGCGFVSKVARMRFSQSVLASLLAWGALATHHGLFAPPMILLGQITVGVIWLLKRRKLLRYLTSFDPGEHKVGWKREIWPFQWRIAVSWLAGYFVFQLFNPVLFAYQGPVAAGRMGMSLTVMSALTTVAFSWMNTKSSPFGALVAQKDYQTLDKLFFRTLKQSTLLLMLACGSVFAGLLVCSHYFPKFAGRVLTPWAFGLLLLSAVMNHIIFSQALYLRAHKAEPFLFAGVFSAIVMAFSTYLLGRYVGVNAVAAEFFIVSSTLGLPVTTFIFLKKRAQWHSPLG